MDLDVAVVGKKGDELATVYILTLLGDNLLVARKR